jgi:hypothetical protein
MSQSETNSQTITVADGDAKSTPITQVSAYISLCLLAAAFGGMVGPTCCRWWAIGGAFGLASSLGLDVLNRTRARAADRARRRKLSRKAEHKLARILGQLDSSKAVHAALQRFQPQSGGSLPRRSGGHGERRLPLDRPVTITRLRRFSGDSFDRLGKPLPGCIRNISRSGFGLAHDRRLERGLVLLEFELPEGPPTQFVADVLWCELQQGGDFYSGGKILDVVSLAGTSTPNIP